jgi:DNA invertase Pin-like site-specific DNA recombinase
MPTKAAVNTATKVVAYYRVSTQRQGASGLGLDGQRAAIEQFCREQRYELQDEFTEVESGRKSDRPVLRKALQRAKATRSLLVIGKLDRLARNVHFISGLMESGVEFRACDVPTANRLTLHILSAVAEEEARAISARTKAALAAAKVRGTLLGAANPACRRLTAQAARKGAERTALLAREANAEASTIATQLRAGGMSLPAIAAELDARGIATRTGRTWNPMGVLRLLRRAA